MIIISLHNFVEGNHIRFKQISLHGFKSFVDKTSIDFPGGITCVVGPNGSGKSNIMDAFRWVFGEQNVKELRGSGMDDIVFSGSDSRKASGFAEVSLTLSDLDDSVTAKWGTFSEITVGRKYYRSGEREYLINNRKCKLKDIREIFYDTGIGARSISIIEQGKVEKIINSSPEDLRIFFEETAGVVKYKEKKKESERRLRQTWDNLSRVNDIISEININIQGLEVQVGQLEVYKKLNTQKIQMEMEYYSNSYALHKNMISDIQTGLNSMKIKLTNKISLFEEQRKYETDLKADLNQLQVDLKVINNSILEIIGVINGYDTEIKLLENNILGADKSKDNISEEIENHTFKLRELTTRRDKSYSDKLITEESLSELKEVMTDVLDVIDSLMYQKESVDDDIIEIDKLFLDLTHKTSNLRNDIYKYETNIQRLEKERERFFREKSDITLEQSGHNENINKIKNSVEDSEVKIINLTDKLGVSTINETYLKGITGELNTEISSLKIDLQVYQKNILLNKDQLETLSFGDKSNREIFQRLNARIIVDFIPMEGAMVQEIGDIIVFETDIQEIVFDELKKIKGSYRFIFKNQLEEFEKYLFSCPIRTVNEFIYKFDNIYKFSGEDNAAYKIAKLKCETELLVSKVDHLKIDIDRKESVLSDKSVEYERILKSNIELKETLQETELEYRSAKKELDSLINSCSRYEMRLSVLGKEIQINIDEEKNCTDLLLKFSEELENQAGKQTEIDEEKTDFEEKRNFLNRKIEDEREVLSEHKINERGLTEKLKANNRDIHYAEQEIVNSTNNISQAKDRLTKLLTVDLSNWQQQLDIKKSKFDESSKKQFILNDSKKYIELKYIEKNTDIEACSKKIELISSETRLVESVITENELKKVQNVSNLESITEAFEEKFQMNIKEKYKTYIITEFQPRKMKSEISQLIYKIEDLGPLNMAAETEFEEVYERHNFLVQQRDDLEDAISKINELIFEINENTAQQFKETFDAVSSNFQDVFKILFGDGKARLSLSNPDDLLTTGVDIFIQPPGKRLQNMNLLSGGEKAMTACTLLFAMFLYKPTPFCFLDEIDAPLDDANISRFIKIVKKLSRYSQFVIITHNQKTMAEADSIYGVTMQEAGVSKLLSVRLENV